MKSCDVGLIGLAVMGENLALNIESRGYRVAVFNRSVEKVTNFIANRASGLNFYGAETLSAFVEAIAVPRRIVVMVKAGKPVDDLLETLFPLLSAGDVVIDGGNSHFPDTERRVKTCADKNILFVGSGVSGGEEGALTGPSIMPGGNAAAWPLIKPVLEAIAAKAPDGTPCCAWMGSGGAGHFVKMVHNGIEYGDMQILCEAYHILREVKGYSNQELEQTFTRWNTGLLSSYLVEITANIFKHTESDGTHTVDVILDAAGQKGTGKWTGQVALDLGVPLTLITEAVSARSLSSFKDLRTQASKLYEDIRVDTSLHMAEDDVMRAVYASKIVSYAQGFALLGAASKEFGWDLDFAAIARVWRAGVSSGRHSLTISQRLSRQKPDLENLLLDPYFVGTVQESITGWRTTAAVAMGSGIPIPQSQRRCRTSTVSEPHGYRRTFSRHSATISGPTYSSVSMRNAASSFMPTGPVAAAVPYQPTTLSDIFITYWKVIIWNIFTFSVFLLK